LSRGSLGTVCGAPTAAAFGLAPTTDPRLIEAGNSFEGVAVNRNRWILAHPTYWSSYVNPLRPSWGEPYREIVERMRGAVVSALDLAEGHEALLVSHQLPVWSLRLFLEGRPLAHDPRRRQCALASLTSLTFEDRTLVGLAYWEPAGDLLRQARDMVPGTSSAQTAGSVSPVSPTSPVSPAGHVEAARGPSSRPRPTWPAPARSSAPTSSTPPTPPSSTRSRAWPWTRA